MKFLSHASIRAKILSLVVALAVTSVCGAAFMADKASSSSATFLEFIEADIEATSMVSRATRNLQSVAYRSYQALDSEPGSPAHAVALESYQGNTEQMVERLSRAIELMPAEATALSSLRDRATQIVEGTGNAIDIDASGDNGAARAVMIETDLLIDDLTTDLRVWSESMSDIVKEKSTALKSESDRLALISLGALIALSVVMAIISLIVSTLGITRPIAALNERMQSLAEGDRQATVPGLSRGDEIGKMADAVEAFRQAAIEKVRLEDEAIKARGMSETERLERERLKAKEAAEIQAVVDALAEGLGKLADGDLSHQLDRPFAGEMDKLRADFNNAVSKLNAAMVSVTENARAIHSGSEEIRVAADDLSRRTEQQAASVEETAAALEEITTTVADSTKRAEEASQLVAKTRVEAERSGDVVNKAIVAMSEIEKSSIEISNIIGLIDDIAFQTNLLALNAGVEAARAGDAGRGFAVVAQEVRELAQRSAKAATEIKVLINASGQQVKSGVALVGETGQALSTIVQEVQEINTHVSAIAESAREQSLGLKEINTAVNSIDQGTQQNAAMVEQSTAASHSLAQEAVALNELMTQFKIVAGYQSQSMPVTKGPAVATDRVRPVDSPARKLGRKLASAFGGGSSAAAVAQSHESWEEF